MSAERWIQCPRCLQKCQEDRTRAIRRAEALYGVAKPAEYIKAIQETKAMSKRSGDRFRESYDIGVDESNGTFTIRYSGRCSKCGLTHTFKHNEEVPI